MKEYVRDGRRRVERELTRRWFEYNEDAHARDPERALRSLPDEPTALFLCYGNICRSPLAERYAKRRFAEEGIEVTVEGAGFHYEEDRSSPDQAQDVAMTAYDVDLGDHRSRQATPTMLSESDIVLVMDVRNYCGVRRNFEGALDKTYFLKSFGSNPGFEIHDPYGHDRAEFEEAYDEVTTAIDGLIESLSQRRATA